jgi:hypothetical protein
VVNDEEYDTPTAGREDTEHRHVRTNLLADSLLLVILDGMTGRFPKRLPLNGVVSVGLLLELLITGRLEVFSHEHRIFVADASETGHPALDQVLTTLRDDEGCLPREALNLFAEGCFDQAVRRLTGSGLLRKERKPRFFGLSHTTTWWHTGYERISELREELDDVLIKDREPDAWTSALISVLVVLGLLDRAVSRDYRERVRPRAEQIAEETWVASTITHAILNNSDPVLRSSLHGGMPLIL